MNTPPPGLIIAAPASGSGKTVLTLGLLRHFRQSGLAVAPFKTGPDYIDAAYLTAAAGRDCVNLDGWAMRPATLAGLIADLEADAELIIGEGVMGLFDGAPCGAGSTADLAALTGWPVVLVIDARGMAASAAAVARGFADHRDDVAVRGIIFNRVGGASHAETLRDACNATDCPPVLGCVPRQSSLALAERYLGLVQATEQEELARFMENAAELVAEHIDLAALKGLATIGTAAGSEDSPPLPPLGQHIAVARDGAFAFAYPWLLEAWRRAGSELSFFSPLSDEAPHDQADAVYLPGGYPELHAGRLAANGAFRAGLARAAERHALVYGECGGYMVLGQALIDGEGESHAMTGLLPHTTSFAEPRLHLGYRRLTLASDGPLGTAGAGFRGHEFHYASLLEEAGAQPLFQAADSAGRPVPPMGAVAGRVLGSFAHLVDRCDD
ncbi:MAG: cobyrinate a,c-diamide synthase [Alphaproteobacteria bacterium]|jgi:cobyrinic acid a,c-diamide synthase